MAKRNFLLGKGEKLVEDIAGVRGGAPKHHPYSFSEAKSRIGPMLTRVVTGIDQLPAAACPDDRVVATFTLHPEYIAKSYFPEKLFESVGLEPVGSRPRRIKPAKLQGPRAGRGDHHRIVRDGPALGVPRLAIDASILARGSDRREGAFDHRAHGRADRTRQDQGKAAQDRERRLRSRAPQRPPRRHKERGHTVQGLPARTRHRPATRPPL